MVSQPSVASSSSRLEAARSTTINTISRVQYQSNPNKACRPIVDTNRTAIPLSPTHKIQTPTASTALSHAYASLPHSLTGPTITVNRHRSTENLTIVPQPTATTRQTTAYSTSPQSSNSTSSKCRQAVHDERRTTLHCQTVRRA